MRRPKFSLLSLLLFTLLIASTTTFILNAPAWKTIPLNTKAVIRSAFSPSGRYLVVTYVTANREYELSIYDTKRGFLLRKSAEYFRHNRITFSSDERIILTAKDNTPVLWDWSNNKVIHTFDENTNGTKYDAYYFFDHNSRRNTWLIPESDLNRKIELQSPVIEISFSNGQHRVLTLCNNGKALIYKLPEGTLLTSIYETSASETLCLLSPDGETAAFAQYNVIRVYSVDASQPMRELKGHTQSIHTIRFLPNGNLVSSSKDQTTREWNTKTGEEIAHLPYENHSSNMDIFDLRKRINQYPANTQSPTATLERNDKAEHFLKIQTRPGPWWGLTWLPEFWTTLVLVALFLWNLFRKPK